MILIKLELEKSITMIRFVKGNLFESEAEALVNTVNTVGVMGKGIALQFKKMYPNNYKNYKTECKLGKVEIGRLLVTEDQNVATGKKIIINFPTKKHWRQPSKYKYIELGIQELVKLIDERKIKSIAIPPLGAGNGGLKWYKVKEILERYLSQIIDCDIVIYTPNNEVKEQLKKERVKLTPARALLLYVLYDLVKNGEFVSEFASEKVCYFLQKFGAKKFLKLEYNAHFYGPYSGKVRHLLFHLNGSYILGFGSKDKKPFDNLSLIMEAESDVNSFVNDDKELKKIAENTKKLLNGFYSSFGLELLSSIDYIMSKSDVRELEFVKNELASWNDRKKTLFNNDDYIKITLDRLDMSESLENNY